MPLRMWGLIGVVVFHVLAVGHAFASDSAMPTARTVSEVAATQPHDALDSGLLRSPRPRPVASAMVVDAGDATRSDQCRWLGQRIVSLLSRDDAMTAKDFNPFYERFGCSTGHLAAAFGCVVAVGGQAQSDDLAIRVDRCWDDPIEGRRPASVLGDGEPADDSREKQAGGT